MNETELAASLLLAPLFATTEMRALHADRAVIGRMLRFEAALARAEAAAGVIPRSAAAAIKSACNPARFDPAALGKGAALAGNPAIPLVKALTAEVAKREQDLQARSDETISSQVESLRLSTDRRKLWLREQIETARVESILRMPESGCVSASSTAAGAASVGASSAAGPPVNTSRWRFSANWPSSLLDTSAMTPRPNCATLPVMLRSVSMFTVVAPLSSTSVAVTVAEALP